MLKFSRWAFRSCNHHRSAKTKREVPKSSEFQTCKFKWCFLWLAANSHIPVSFVTVKLGSMGLKKNVEGRSLDTGEKLRHHLWTTSKLERNGVAKTTLFNLRCWNLYLSLVVVGKYDWYFNEAFRSQFACRSRDLMRAKFLRSFLAQFRKKKRNNR